MVVFSVGQPLVQTCLTGAMSKSMNADIQGRVQGSIAALMAIAMAMIPKISQPFELRSIWALTFLDTGDFYGMGHNELLIREAIKGIPRDQVFIAVKFGVLRNHKGNFIGHDNRPVAVQNFLAYSLQRLGVDYIDLYYPARIDPHVPIKETIGAIADLIQEGKVRYAGLSEASAQTLRRATQIHPIAMLQTEYSLWTREPETDLLPVCRELGTSLVAYSPLGRGFLTGVFQSPDNFPPGDWRRHSPRFQGENFYRNLELVEKIKEIASQKQCTPAQLALAWLLAKGEEIIPIPGTKRQTRLHENISALDSPNSIYRRTKRSLGKYTR